MTNILKEFKNIYNEVKTKQDVLKSFLTSNSETLNNIYFWHPELHAYCKLEYNSANGNALNGYIDYLEYYIGTNFHIDLPAIYYRKHTFKINNIPDIKIISRKEFTDGLRHELNSELWK